MKIYEYIFAAVIIVAMLIAALFLTSITPQLYRSASEIDQLKMAAQKIMVEILLNPGRPPDWGENITVRAGDISSFGLAAYTMFTRSAYVLDPDKVQRLSQKFSDHLPQLYVQPGNAQKLLNLGLEYGIRMEFIPALNVNVEERLDGIRVNVLSELDVPVAGAAVRAGAIYASGGEIKLSTGAAQTDYAGNCIISLQYSRPALLIVIVDYQGVQMIKAVEVGDPHNAFLIGRFMLIKQSVRVADNRTYQIFVARFPNGSLSLRYVGCSLSQLGYNINGYIVYDMGYAEPNIIAAAALTEGGSLLAAYKHIPSSYGYTSGEVYPPLAYMIERSVKIGLSTFTLRLRVWRTSW